MNLNEILKRKLNIIDSDCEASLMTDIQKIYSNINPPVSRSIALQLKAFEPTMLSSIIKKHRLFTTEMCRILKESNQKIDENHINLITEIVEEKFGADKYKDRINTFLSSIERIYSRYGLVFDQNVYRTDLMKTTYSCSVQNYTRKIRADIAAELHLLIIAQNNETDFLSNANEIIDLKPNFFGLGVNLNNLLKKIIKKRT